jgi:hypothetical protein
MSLKEDNKSRVSQWCKYTKAINIKSKNELGEHLTNQKD